MKKHASTSVVTFCLKLAFSILALTLAFYGANNAVDAGRFAVAPIPAPLARLRQQHCSQCHDKAVHSGGLDLTAMSFDLSDRSVRAQWMRIHDRVERGEMPPKSVAFSPAQRAELLKLLGAQLHAADQADIIAAGRGPLRRLNRDEYEQNLRDLLQLPHLDIRDQLPADREAYHFNKVSETLDMSRVQLMAYLDAAEVALHQAMVKTAQPPAPMKYRAVGKQLSFVRSIVGEKQSMFFARNSVSIDSSEKSEEAVMKFEQLTLSRLQNGASLADALLSGYKAFLCSDLFLYWREPVRANDQFAIANRLSHFLTDTRPDAMLLGLAQQGKLRNAEVFRRETDRLIASKGFDRFVTHFTDYWLSLRELRRDDPDIRLYPEYRLDDYLVESMELETRAFFTAMVRENLPATTLIDADFTFANDRLAQHYGLPMMVGSNLRKVMLPQGSPYGGLLTQGAILKVTTNGVATSPVLRGAWVMDRLIGQPPSPPPPGIPAVEPDIRGAKSMRDLLALHTKSTMCASCHAKFDPVGLALENFDVMGRWRTRYRGLETGERISGIDRSGHDFSYTIAGAVDASGQLADGRNFKDVYALKAIFKANSRQLARNLLHQFTVYATGTPVRFADRREIESILDACAKNDYRVGDLLRASWTRDGVLLPAEDSATALYQKMFVQGDAAAVQQQLRRLEERGSILDTLNSEASRFSRNLGSADKARLDQYFTSVREVQQRLVIAREWETRPLPKATQAAPTAIQEGKYFFEKFELMLDMAQLAFESDSTRIVTLMLDAFWTPIFKLEGKQDTTESYHGLSHHGQNEKKLRQLEAADRQHMTVLNKLMTHLADKSEGGERLLDRTMVLYGSNMGEAKIHDNTNLPIILAGGGFKHGQHLAFKRNNNTPLCNLFVSMLHRMGVEVDAFGSSTGPITELASV